MLLQWNKLSKLIAYPYYKIFLYVTYLMKSNPAPARNTKPGIADTWIRNQQMHFMEKKSFTPSCKIFISSCTMQKICKLQPLLKSENKFYLGGGGENIKTKYSSHNCIKW